MIPSQNHSPSTCPIPPKKIQVFTSLGEDLGNLYEPPIFQSSNLPILIPQSLVNYFLFLFRRRHISTIFRKAYFTPQLVILPTLITNPSITLPIPRGTQSPNLPIFIPQSFINYFLFLFRRRHISTIFRKAYFTLQLVILPTLITNPSITLPIPRGTQSPNLPILIPQSLIN
ncbi:hypothetical protein SAMN05421761_12023 [Belliella pelovolcani]|uniref:Uncharacterized protein n=1 Tax=Belliella pelovolcani TaxID=529505 RepID=A0A1N7PSM6_9BACT|nr:hypothetical protein SAMN05421761_12023 [Belliella pelovolcani]